MRLQPSMTIGGVSSRKGIPLAKRHVKAIGFVVSRGGKSMPYGSRANEHRLHYLVLSKLWADDEHALALSEDDGVDCFIPRLTTHEGAARSRSTPAFAGATCLRRGGRFAI